MNAVGRIAFRREAIRQRARRADYDRDVRDPDEPRQGVDIRGESNRREADE